MLQVVYETVQWNYALRVIVSFHWKDDMLGNSVMKLCIETGLNNELINAQSSCYFHSMFDKVVDAKLLSTSLATIVWNINWESTHKNCSLKQCLQCFDYDAHSTLISVFSNGQSLTDVITAKLMNPKILFEKNILPIPFADKL